MKKLRDFIQHNLGINLILAPSYANGDYEFRRSAMAGAEEDCNTVWCNTCSALNGSLNGITCFITSYSKNREHNGLQYNTDELLDNNKCSKDCTKGKPCLLCGDLYASSKKESV